MRTQRAIALAVSCAALGGCLLGAGPATAKTIKPYAYSSSFFGTDTTAGAFVNPSYIAVDEANQRVYVIDRSTGANGSFSQFDMAGNAVPFGDPDLVGASSIGLGNVQETYTHGSETVDTGPDIAVDNSGGDAAGNVYVLKPPSTILGFDSSGKPLPGPNWPVCGSLCDKFEYWGHAATGVATGLDGTIWAGIFGPEGAGGFDSTGALTSDNALIPIDPSGALSTSHEKVILKKIEAPLAGGWVYVTVPAGGSTSINPRRFDFDADGNFYLFGTPLFAKSSPSGENLMQYNHRGEILNKWFAPLIANEGSVVRQPDVAVDRSSDLVFANLGNAVNVYEGSGTQLDTIGTGGGYPGLTSGRSPGVAVDSTTGKVFAANQRLVKATGTRTSGSPTITGLSIIPGFWPFMVGRTVTGSGIPSETTVTEVTATTLTLSKNATSNGTYTTASPLSSQNPPSIDVFAPGAPVLVPDVATLRPSSEKGASTTLRGTVDPDNGGAITKCEFKWGTTTALTNAPIPCSGPLPGNGTEPVEVTAPVAGLVTNTRYHYRLVVSNQPAGALPQAGKNISFNIALPPLVSDVGVDDVNTNNVKVNFTVDPREGISTYRVEVGETASYGTTIRGGVSFTFTGSPLPIRTVSVPVKVLTPDTTYHYRVVATNEAGETASADNTFKTFPFVAAIKDPCPNALSRQQTGSALLLDCRAYELVSAANQGGYNVASDLAPGQSPYPGYPDAEDKLLYTVHNGGIPGAGKPTNLGSDPYVATRGTDGWETSYVGIEADGTPSLLPFSSNLIGADAGLHSFAFGGPEICAPCFADGSSNIPVRIEGGAISKGMAGSLNPAADPAGEVRKHFSGDGSHFIFGSTSKFETAGNSGSVSIYDRDLDTGTTQVASTMPDGTTMSGTVAALDVSEDGSRILVGKLVSTDAEGNEYFDLYMHVGTSPNSVPIADTTNGALYDGMSADGTKVYFTTSDPIGGETDASADLFGADVGALSATVARVSTGSEGTGDTNACIPTGNWNLVSGGPNCGIVAIGGGGGVASDSGDVFFLSPEKLDGAANGTQNEPNLYVAKPGSAPSYVTTLELGNGAVVNGVADSEKRNTADFGVNGSGSAVFTTTISAGGYENNGFSQVLRYDGDAAQITCVSCPASNALATGNATLASAGLSISDDGRVFFNAADRLALRDSNKRRDVYEWSPANGGTMELISTGTSSEHSSLLSASSDGTDVFFFTRQKLVSQDQNGPVVKVYDAREEGGFFVIAPPQPCKASDECHGPSSAAAVPPPVRTIAGTQGQTGPDKSTGPKKCRKPLIKRRGKCVRKSQARSKKQARSKRNSTRRDG